MRYAKEDVYAEVEEEGGKINRLVAAAGQPVPAAYDHLVKDSDTTDTPPDGTAVLASRQRVDGVAADPAHGYGPTADESGITDEKPKRRSQRAAAGSGE